MVEGERLHRGKFHLQKQEEPVPWADQMENRTIWRTYGDEGEDRRTEEEPRGGTLRNEIPLITEPTGGLRLRLLPGGPAQEDEGGQLEGERSWSRDSPGGGTTTTEDPAGGGEGAGRGAGEEPEKRREDGAE